MAGYPSVAPLQAHHARYGISSNARFIVPSSLKVTLPRGTALFPRAMLFLRSKLLNRAECDRYYLPIFQLGEPQCVTHFVTQFPAVCTGITGEVPRFIPTTLAGVCCVT